MRPIRIVLLVLFLLVAGLAYYLFRPLSIVPAPAEFTCLDLSEGTFIALDSLPQPSVMYGMGLTYSQHLIETAAEYDPAALPPIFKKSIRSITKDQNKVKLPSAAEMITASEQLENGVGAKLEEEYEEFSPLLDYEVEMGFVLLESISAEDLKKDDFVPQLGYFISNDLSARSIALLGEGSTQRYEFWGISKSFPNFTPMSDKIWVPEAPTANSIPCIRIETYVNGELRQSQTTDNMIFTPLQMLRFIHKKYPNASLKAGDMVLTGTPGGVAIATPRALVRLGDLLGMDRYRKLSLKLGGDVSAFLKEGDIVEIRGDGFESVSVEIVK